MFWQDVTPSSLCSGVKECGTKLAHNFLFLKSSFRIRRTTELRMFKDSAIILDAIRRSCLVKRATAAMFTSVLLDFGRPPISSFSTSSLPSRNPEYNLKTFDRFRATFSYAFGTSTSVSSHIDRLWNKLLWQMSVHFPHQWLINKTDFTRQVIPRTLLKINKPNSVCEGMSFDST